MHAFDPNTGWSCFEFDASPNEPVFLVGDFNGWRTSTLRMNYVGGRWRLRLRLAEGRYYYAFQFCDGFYGGGVAEVPFYVYRPAEDWMQSAVRSCTCGRHFWKWN
ncbi:MAG: glycogen-binding domain-containing protein [Verrucomicrobia subdivision 3 bacterium]|nr:glycogen-binding domain-containing protein [Limisphaerales bacterium]